MSQDFYINPDTHDIDLVDGTQLRLCEDKRELIRQKLEIRLLKIRGEWYINLLDGVPYFESIFGKNKKKAADAIFKRTIKNTEGVIKITRFESELSEKDGRLYRLKFSVTTDEGPIDDLEVNL